MTSSTHSRPTQIKHLVKKILCSLGVSLLILLSIPSWAQTPTLVYDLYSSGTGISNNIIGFDNKIYFEGRNNSTGYEWFVYDPSVATSSSNPQLVYDLRSGGSSSNIGYPIILNNKMYFGANNGSTGTEMYVYDPSIAASSTNPQVVYDLRSGTSSGGFSYPIIHDNKIYFRATDGITGSEIYVYDPSIAASSTNPQLIYDLRTGSSSGNFYDPIIYNDKIYFEGNNGSTGSEMYVYDPSVAASSTNPQVVYDLYSGTLNGYFNHPIIYNDKIYFEGNNGSSGNEMFVYDPSIPASSSNPQLVYDLSSGSAQGKFQDPIIFNDRIYFEGDPLTTGREMYVYDPSIAASSSNPQLVYDINSGASDGLFNEPVIFDNKIYFEGDNGSSGDEMFVYDPSVATSSTNPQVNDLRSGSSDGDFLYPVVYQGAIYFSGDNGTSGNELFKISVDCESTNPLADAAGQTYSGSYKTTDVDGWTHYCEEQGKLLLSLKIGSSGAVVPADSLRLKLGANKTTSWSTSGGYITNSKGGAMIDRMWDVKPSTSPTSNVGVKYYFTNDEYIAIKDTLANHNNGKNVPGNAADTSHVASVTELNMLKTTTAGSFLNPHGTGVSGLVLAHGATPSTTVWKHSSHLSTDHIAEFEVSSFSGGGGGGGGGGGTGSSALPVELIHFVAQACKNNSAKLDWATASEINNSHFEIQRSLKGTNFITIGQVEGHGTSNNVNAYQFLDSDLPIGTTYALYRLKQIDYDGQFEYTDMQSVQFDHVNMDIVSIFPNPFTSSVYINLQEASKEDTTIEIIDMKGTALKIMKLNRTENIQRLELNELTRGIYFINIVAGNQIKHFKVIKK